MALFSCRFEGCDRVRHNRREYCKSHDAQLWRGAPLTALKTKKRTAEEVLARDHEGRKKCKDCLEWKPVDDYSPSAACRDGLRAGCRSCRLGVCEVTGCGVRWADSSSKANPFCAKHRARFQRHGDVNVVLNGYQPAGADHPMWLGREVSYTSAHFRIKRLWGAASQFSCVFDCGQQAQDWAYDNSDPSELYGPTIHAKAYCFYSPYPEFYMPLCRKCHKNFDTKRRVGELRTYRQGLVEAAACASV